MTKKLYVGNLPPNCTKEDLEDLLKKFGGIAECDVISNKNFGFVHMQSETEAQEAVTQLDSTDFMGSILKVQFSTTDVHKSPGVGSKGECFRCGSKGHLSRACPKNVGGGNRGRGGGRGGRGGRGGMGGARRGGGPDMRGRRGPPPPPPMRREPPPRGVFRDDFSDDLYYREREERLRRPLSREMEYERRYLDEAYRRMAYPPHEYELLYRSRSRSPIRGYDSEYRRPMPAGEREYYERMYGAGAGARSARDLYYDMPLRSRLQGPSRAGPSRY